VAKYEVLAHQLKEQIERGVWVENEKLPSLRKQAAQTGFSLMTVLHAYQMLESQGIVSSQERSGFLVTAKANNASKERVQATEAVSINVPTINVAPGEKRNVPFSVEALSPMANTMQSVSFVSIDKSTNSVIGSEVMFYSGNNRQM